MERDLSDAVEVNGGEFGKGQIGAREQLERMGSKKWATSFGTRNESWIGNMFEEMGLERLADQEMGLERLADRKRVRRMGLE
jgi:hypothetical protein